jgi:autotransporter adhesin
MNSEATAISDFSQATQAGATAIGGESIASGVNSVAVGEQSSATDFGAVAVGNYATATNSSVAIGQDARATGIASVALGSGASAAQTFSSAIGRGAVTTRDNELALGGAGSSVVIGDIVASTGAQVGPTSIVTVDASGTLGQDTTIRPAISALQVTDSQQNLRITALEAAQSSIGGRVETVNRNGNGGIAAAMAMGGTVMPADAKMAVSFNLATYRGEQGFSASGVARATKHIYFQGGFAGSTVKGSTGARVGATFAW